MHVSSLSIIFMVISALISVLGPIILFIYIRKKYQAKAFPILVGALAFIIFALVLEPMLHAVVLKPEASGNIALLQKPFLYMLYGALDAGVFEETARFVSFHLIKKKHHDYSTALSYGIGHGGVEAIIIGAVSMISTIALSMLINSGQINTMLNSLSGLTQQTLQAQVNSVVETPSYLFLISGFERILTILIQISLSVIVFYAVNGKNKLWFFPLAILLHAIVDAPVALYQAKVITNIFLIEGYLLICTIVLVYFRYRIHQKMQILNQHYQKYNQ